MVSFTVRMRFEMEHHDQVAEILRQLTGFSRQEPGCVSYVAHFVESDPSTVLIYEQYRNEDAVEEHRTSAHFHKYAVAGLYQLMRAREIENLTAIC